MSEVVGSLLAGFDWFVLVYFVALNTSYLILILIAARESVHHLRRPHGSVREDIFANPMTPGITVLLPAYNESAGIVQSTRATLALRYPEFEVIVIDDGSTDDTFAVLQAEFDLVDIAPAMEDDLPTLGDVRSMHVPRNGDPLIVIRKVNVGKRADALNVGLNAARHPLVCCVDGDSLLEPEALLRVAAPFVEDPDRVIATGGVIRAVNGSTVHRGQVTQTRQPDSWIARIQIIEYLRSFLLGRTGWSRLDALLIISGAFGLYRRDLLVRVGGFDPTSLGEDLDVLVSLHRLHRDERRDYRVVFVAEPVCWTEVPQTRSVLARQRRRWSHGLAQVLWKQRGMIGNPRYGRIGMVALPYYVMFELLGPVVELVGVATVIAGFAFGVVDVQFALLFIAVAVLYGILLSVAALLVEEAAYHRYGRWRDLVIGVAASILENLGYRQMHAWWRLRGLFTAMRRREAVWGDMKRSGFQLEQPS